jgi:hypothetical protein
MRSDFIKEKPGGTICKLFANAYVDSNNVRFPADCLGKGNRENNKNLNVCFST